MPASAGASSATSAAGGPGQTAITSPPPTVAGPTNKPGTGAALPAAPGTYKYRQSGSTTFGSSTKPVPAEGTLLIDPAMANGDQVDHRTTDPGQPPSDTTFSFRGGGVFLVQQVMRTSVGGSEQTFTCTFNPPLPTPPWPPAVGRSYSGDANCGPFTVHAAGRVTGTHDVVIAGVTHHTYVLNTALTFQGQLAGSGTQLDWIDPATSLILHEAATTKANYAGLFAIASSVTSDIESTRPS